MFVPVSVPAQGSHVESKPAVIGYVFPQNTILKPTDIDGHSLTRINYAFANIQGGRMVAGFSHDAENLAVLTTLRGANPSLKILVSVGGWLWSGGFSDVALTPQSRAVFIASVDDFLTRYDLDGLDIDWEYPGMTGAGHVFRSEDKANFTLLLKELRADFGRKQKRGGRRMILSIAAGASDEFLAHTEMREVQKYLDTVNLMSYDYYEPEGDKITGHHAPLFTNPADPKKISADASVLAFEAAGVPAAKIVLGVPFYGHVWGRVADKNHGLYQPGQPIPNAYSPYSVIVDEMKTGEFERFWDPAASEPYLYNAGKQIFVTYDDPESISAKCSFVLKQRLGGVMFWDYAGDPSGTLLGTINKQLGRATAAGKAVQ
nr:glycoside hydrolase family 18 protein [Granulicella aggregans]